MRRDCDKGLPYRRDRRPGLAQRSETTKRIRRAAKRSQNLVVDGLSSARRGSSDFSRVAALGKDREIFCPQSSQRATCIAARFIVMLRLRSQVQVPLAAERVGLRWCGWRWRTLIRVRPAAAAGKSSLCWRRCCFSPGRITSFARSSPASRKRPSRRATPFFPSRPRRSAKATSGSSSTVSAR